MDKLQKQVWKVMGAYSFHVISNHISWNGVQIGYHLVFSSINAWSEAQQESNEQS